MVAPSLCKNLCVRDRATQELRSATAGSLSEKNNYEIIAFFSFLLLVHEFPPVVALYYILKTQRDR